MTILWLWGILFSGALGACLGSFANVVIVRWPQEESVVVPRSHCPRCQAPIAFYDNIPIISFLILRAKCRHCHEPISWRYPLVEAFMALIFILLFLKVGFKWALIEYLLFAWGVITASVIDMDTRLLPDVLTLPGILVGLAGALLNPERRFVDSLLGVVVGGGSLWLVAFIYQSIKHEEGMGGGDVKLLAWIGAVLGWKATVFTILFSSLSGSLIGGITALIQKSGMKTAIPFGPFLAGSALLYIFVGEPIIAGYLAIFFPFSS